MKEQYKILINHLNNYITLDSELRVEVINNFQPKNMSKGDYFLKTDEQEENSAKN